MNYQPPGPNFLAFKEWVFTHKPALAKEIGSMRHQEVRLHLNKITGLCVSGDERLESGYAQHLIALKAGVGGFGPHIKKMGTPITGHVQIYEDKYPNS